MVCQGFRRTCVYPQDSKNNMKELTATVVSKSWRHIVLLRSATLESTTQGSPVLSTWEIAFLWAKPRKMKLHPQTVSVRRVRWAEPEACPNQNAYAYASGRSGRSGQVKSIVHACATDFSPQSAQHGEGINEEEMHACATDFSPQSTQHGLENK